MNPAESLALTRFVRAACPQQKFDEYTPDAWHELLGDLRIDDCRAAVKALGQRQPFISPAEIRAEVRKIRADRLRAVPSSELEPADIDPNDVAAYQKARAKRVQSIADGVSTPNPPTGIGPRQNDVRELLSRSEKQLPEMPPAHPRTDKAALAARDAFTQAIHQARGHHGQATT